MYIYGDEIEVKARGLRARGASRRDISRELGITVDEAISLEALVAPPPLTDEEFNKRRGGFHRMESWQRDLIIALAKRGRTYKQIAEQVGCTHAAVYYVLKRNRNKKKSGGRPIGARKKARMMELLKAGELPGAVARKVGVSHSTAQRYSEELEAGLVFVNALS